MGSLWSADGVGPAGLGASSIGSPRGQHHSFTGGRSDGGQLPPVHHAARQIPSMKEGMMIAFAMMTLLGLAVLAVTAIASRYVSIAAKTRA